MAKKFDWEEFEMFERRGSRVFARQGEISSFDTLHKIIKECDSKLEGSGIVRKALSRREKKNRS